jgi:hypothetical protein
MTSRLRRILGAPALFLLAGGFGVCAIPAEMPRLPEQLPSAWSSPWAMAKLDGDNRLDVAVSRVEGRSENGYVYRIDLTLSSGTRADSFTVAVGNGWGINITPRDVDGDHDLDLVITSGLDRQPVGVWINDGNGSFSEAELDDHSDAIWLEESSVAAADLASSLPALSFQQIRQFFFLAEDGWIQPRHGASPAGNAENHVVPLNSQLSRRSSRAPPRSLKP